jgi:hypothetical protein
MAPGQFDKIWSGKRLCRVSLKPMLSSLHDNGREYAKIKSSAQVAELADALASGFNNALQNTPNLLGFQRVTKPLLVFVCIESHCFQPR